MNSLTESPTAEIIHGKWNIIKGKLKQKYAALTDNDLRYVEGQEEELLGRIQKLTGKSRQEIEKLINDIFHRR
jgi:uncharacterized protein YjbJ (UPF0337 family)